MSGSTYRDAGVDIEAGDKAVELIKDVVAVTKRPEVMSSLGGFAAAFDASFPGYKNPVLVTGTDGVGTKTLIAQTVNRHDTIGIDAVAMVVDDIVCEGAEPLFVLDYLAVGKVVPEKVAELVSGIAKGCKISGASLVGGETAEHPGVMEEDEYDVSTFAVGVVEADCRIGPHLVRSGDVLIGLASSGLHANGYSLVRKLVLDNDLTMGDAFGESTLGDVLLEPCRIHSPGVLAAIKSGGVRAAAHVTGGGIVGNLPRCLPESLGASVDTNSWKVPEIFTYLESLGDIAAEEAWRVFNRGIGMFVVVSPESVDASLAALKGAGEDAFIVGEVVEKPGVTFR